MFTTSTLGHFQPLAWLSLALDHGLFGLSGSLDAPEAGAFHRTSVLLHALTAVLVLGLARGVLRRALPRARRPPWAWARSSPPCSSPSIRCARSRSPG